MSRCIPAEAKRWVLRQYRHQRQYVGRDPFDAMDTIAADYARVYADAALSGDTSGRADEILDRYHAARWYFSERICTPFGERVSERHYLTQTDGSPRLRAAAILDATAARIKHGEGFAR